MNKKIVYFDCSSGVSSDMLLGSLIDLGADIETIRNECLKLPLPKSQITANKIKRKDVEGMDFSVNVYYEFQHEYDFLRGEEDERELSRIPEHDHGFKLHKDKEHGNIYMISMEISEIIRIFEESSMNSNVKQMALNIYKVIAEAEAKVHNVSADDIVLHEVGRAEQIITVAGICTAIDMLGINKIMCSAVRDGSGHVMTSHGKMQVPVPAVLEIIKKCDIPIIIDSEHNTEMVTPTGIGALVGLGAEYAKSPSLKPDKIGYGFGKRETGLLAAVRAILAEESN